MQEYTVRVYRDRTEWRQGGELHREDGPAIEYANGDKSWWQHGKHHREDGPAVEYPNGYKAWCQKGLFHRLDGPAIEYASGLKEWWVDGKIQKFNKLKAPCDGKIVEIDGKKYKLEAL